MDTEVAIGEFKNNNYKIVNDPSKAEIIVINTCGFIESAKEEAINTILEMAEYKKHKCKYLIAMGCLVQRYYNDLIKLLPEVDLFIRIDEYTNFWNKVEQLIKEKEVKPSKLTRKANSLKPIPMVDPESFLERVVTTGKKYAYLKIGEGCSNNCTYCAIPYIRGAFISRPMDDIIKEAQILAKQGYEEIIVIAQDTTKYGVDLYGKTKLAEILHKISEIKGIKWIRFLYSYPEGITNELIQEVKNNPKIIKYFDIPIQHISNDLLKRMNRKTSKENIEKLIKNIRKDIPDAILRTSIIVGFPGETKEQFEELLEFIETAKFDKLGAFTYSKEEGTPAAKMPNQIHGNTKKSRYNKLMEKQQKISKQKLEDKIGKTIETLIEDVSFDGKYLIGRTKNDVPEIDGIVYIKAPFEGVTNDYINTFVKCKIENVNNYDLIGKIVK
ncbi:MAG: 30S ribosomal protein S12 methylthiotransferase RimO [Clostridia bacterium]|nr:30S ribosomal protein S12 methylthiotransferase RimO [Clostridia bacterium]